MGSLREYETVFVLRPNVEDSRVEDEVDGVRQTIQAGSGEILGVERWGRRKLAYEIRKVNEGIYTLIRFRGGPGLVQELERRYRLREDVLRHLTVVSQGLPSEPVIRREAEPAQPGPDAAEPGSLDEGARMSETGPDTTTSSGEVRSENRDEPDADPRWT